MVTLELRQGDSDYNHFRISGSDAQWVKSLFTRMKETIDSFPPTESWVTRHPGLVGMLAIIGLGSLAHFLISAAAFASLKFGIVRITVPAASPALFVVLSWFTRLLLGLTAWGLVKDWWWKAFPSVELAFGPEHMRLAERRRKTLAFLFTAVIIPIVLTILLEARWPGF